MVSRSSSHHHHRTRFLSRKSLPLVRAFQIFCIFAFSIFVFLVYVRNSFDDEKTPSFLPSRSPNQKEKKNEPFQARETPDEELWNAPFSRGLQKCVKPTTRYKAAINSERYMTVKSNGGLNQMRTGIADMVAVAHIMNATLVIPQLDKRSFWRDSSVFSDVFDENHFIKSLRGDIRVVKELPKDLETVPRARKHFTSWASVGYYEEMTQTWNTHKVLHVAKSDSRLANNDLPIDIQRLRCRALYQALRFIPPIESLGKKLVERLRSRGERYIALHLRYEKDMLAFTGCNYGLTDAESEELRVMRETTNYWKVKKINSTEQRAGGFCPLTPKEVGIFLRALGYPPSTQVYIAAGKIYGGDSHLSELKSHFPNIVFKETLARKEELRAFANHASQSAALDYIISIESDVFVPTHSGNMARAVEGHRRFLGHLKTISPDRGYLRHKYLMIGNVAAYSTSSLWPALIGYLRIFFTAFAIIATTNISLSFRKGLVEIFDMMDNGELEESSLPRLVQRMHANMQGNPRKRYGPLPGIKGRGRLRTEESFYENPYPECICTLKHHF